MMMCGCLFDEIKIYIAKLSRMCYDELMSYALLKSSVLRWLHKQDDDEDKS